VKQVLAALAVLAVLAWSLAPLHYPLIGADGSLPPLDEPCLEERILGNPGIGEPFEAREVLICTHHEDWGTVGLMDEGAPVGAGEVFKTYWTAEGLRWTNFHLSIPFPWPGWAATPRVRDEALASTHLGYAGWAPGQLQAEIEAGAWTVLAPTDDEPEER